MVSREMNDNQRIVSINYGELDILLDRQEYMTKTLQNYLDKNGNVQEITESFISANENTYLLNFILTTVD